MKATSASLTRRLLIAGWFLQGAVALAQTRPAEVTIEGGRDETGQNYKWTVHNNSALAITSVRFPHYHADIFTTPPGWTQQCTAMVGAGEPDGPGECVANALSPAHGIAPGQSASFGMRIARSGTYRRAGEVAVTFADGRRINVPNVDLTGAAPFIERYGMPIGLGLILAIVVSVQAARRRRRPGADQRPPETTNQPVG